jgi:hypothetical protein
VRPSRRWKTNVRISLREPGYGGVNLIHLTPDTGSCEHGNEPSGSIKVGEFNYIGNY